MLGPKTSTPTLCRLRSILASIGEFSYLSDSKTHRLCRPLDKATFTDLGAANQFAANKTRHFVPVAIKMERSERRGTMSGGSDRRGTIFEAVCGGGIGIHDQGIGALRSFASMTMDKLPDKLLMNVFAYLHHKQLLKCTLVSKKWRTVIHDPRLWQVVSLRSDYNGLQVTNHDALLALIGVRFGITLRLIELPMELIQVPIITELANKCPKLQDITLDFSSAMQLHDFNDLQTFPARLKSMTICLSEVIFLEGFMRKIYNFISCLEILHIIGTYEKVEDEESEVYEVVNLNKLKAYVPNLRVINFWGVVFLNDEHLDAISTNCVNLEVLCVNYCQKVKGSSFRAVFHRCRKLKTLLLEQCLLDSKQVMLAKWEDTIIQELNITATELSSEALISVLTRLPNLRWLSAGFLEQFTTEVLESWMNSGATKNIQALDLNTCDSLEEHALAEFVSRHGHQMQGLNLGGLPKLIEGFWMTNIPIIRNIKILVMGIPEDCCPKVTAKIHIDQFIDCIANNCSKLERLEIRWDPETLRFSDKSSKFIDTLRLKCLRLRALTLSDGRYFELVRSNFERADRISVVRTTTMCHTSIAHLLQHYAELLFN